MDPHRRALGAILTLVGDRLKRCVAPCLGPASAYALLLLAASSALCAQSSRAQHSLRPEYVPPWAGAPVLRELVLDRDPQLDDVANGARLRAAVLALAPGERLTVGPGTYSVDALFEVASVGTAQAPIRIEARAGATPVLTRPDAGQNLLNLGTSAQAARFLLWRGFELRGGSIGVRIRAASDVWLDALHIHHTGADGVRAAEADTSRLVVTRCEVSHTAQQAGTGEGFYLGANSAAVAARDAVIALNHVHHTGGTQGDGIELKQGSFGCLVAENLVHDTPYPGILAYGTGGAARNVIEANVVFSTLANPFQVQGEALVRNNLVFGGANAAFVSFDHQGQVRDLEVVHNTFVATTGEAARLQHWGGRPGMVLANNALYSASGTALTFLTGAGGVAIAGNVVHGSTWNDGGANHVQGLGSADFVDLAFDGARRDAHPSPASRLRGVAAAPYHATTDGSGAARTSERSAGAFEAGTYGRYLGAGGLTLRTDGAPGPGAPLRVDVSRGPAGAVGVLGLLDQGLTGGLGQVQRVLLAFDGAGRASVVVTPSATAVVTRLRAQARDAASPGGVAASQWVELVR